MTLKVFKYDQHDGKIRKNRKENHFYKEYSLVTNTLEEGFKTPLIVRIYATDSRHYACLWLGTGEIHTSGGGFAGGYGYCRESQAVEDAFIDAGINVGFDFGGRGASEVRKAIKSVAVALGYSEKQFFIHEAHA